MNNNEDKIKFLIEKSDSLLRKQDELYKEIKTLQTEISKLKNEEIVETSKVLSHNIETPVFTNEIKEKISVKVIKTSETPTKKTEKNINVRSNEKSNLEKFIGENLINKVGIIITIIGVAIGAKYSIEHNLISPIARIILGYLLGFGLLGFGIKLKSKYENYSAVLVSGAMAIMYFITYFAYSIYNLIPLTLTFILMLFFTAFTVIAALKYNKQIIALIGMVGAYAIPFLLSNDEGNALVLFVYMTILNIGILLVSYKNHWKALYYISFSFTWLIFFTWSVFKYEEKIHFGLALIFVSIFYLIFYFNAISYKIFKNEKFEIEDVIMIIVNSLIFFGLGYSFLNGHSSFKNYLGLFTLINALIHFGVSFFVSAKKLADKSLFYLVLGLVLVFITIAIPIELNGNWVTLLWIGESVILFWIGKTKNISFYEKLSYPIMAFAFFSLIHDWQNSYGQLDFHFAESKITPIFNINFLTSLLFILGFGFITYLNYNKEDNTNSEKYISNISFKYLLIIAMLIFVCYFAFFIEIDNFLSQKSLESKIMFNKNDNYSNLPAINPNYIEFKSIWLINYSIIFAVLLSLINIKKIKNNEFGIFNIFTILISLLVFLLLGLYSLSELRENYLNQDLNIYYKISSFNISIRYICIAILISLLYTFYKLINQSFMKVKLKIKFEIITLIAIIWVLSSELFNWMDIYHSSKTYKLALSILWGMCSLIVVVYGIWKGKQHLRFTAIILFGITLLKLFFYDISHLNTISKTLIFIILGVLLLIISFLYNKYKHLISDETKD